MSYGDYDPSSPREIVKLGPFQIAPLSPMRFLLTIFLPALVIAIPLQVVYDHSHPWGKFQNPHIKAAPYVWPSGCEQKHYVKGSGYGSISGSCATRRYYLGGGRIRRRNKRLQRLTPEFYRVGNDAVAIICNFSQCAPHYVYYNVFYQDDNIHGK